MPQTRGPFAPEEASVDLRSTGLSVFHQRQASDDVISGTLWPLETVDALPPSDLAFAFPQFQQSFPYLAFPITFALPPVGSTVTCVGYTVGSTGVDILAAETLETGQLGREGHYSHTFHVVEGTVKHIFVRQFSSGYLAGPCFTIDAEVPHGLSGGPVLTGDGAVCGVVSAGASTFFDSPTTLISPFYPALLSAVRFGVSLGPVRINANHPLINLIGRGDIRTDGSEEQVGIAELDGRAVACAHIPRVDHPHVYDDFAGFQSGTGATPLEGKYRRLRRISQEEGDAQAGSRA